MSPTIYGPQQWTAGTFSHSAYYQSSNFGGAGTPDPNYPELASCENVHTTVGGGPSGENTVDALNTADYTSAGIALLGFGPLANGQFDMRGPVIWEFDCKPKSSALAEAGVNLLAVLANGGGDAGTGGLSGGINAFVQISQQQTSGASFTWELIYFKGETFTPGDVTSASGTIDDAWHHYKIIYTPCTITGAFDVIAADGRIQFFQDDVVIYDLTGITCCPNNLATAEPEAYYARGIWHGYSDLAGPITNDYLYRAAGIAALPVAPPAAPQAPCDPQAQVTNGGKGHYGCNPGGQGWTSSYSGGYGAVPQHADPSDGETLTDKRAFDVWVEVDVLSYPALTTTTYRRALAEIADAASYYGGRKPSGLLAVGELEHGLGNEQGGFEAASADIDWSDVIDRLFRTLLADQDLDGNEARVYAASPAARAALTAPRLLFRGIVQQARLQ